MFHCPAHPRCRDLLLKVVDSIDAVGPIWSEPPLIKALGQYISSTKTGFLPEMNIDFALLPSPCDNSPTSLEGVATFK